MRGYKKRYANRSRFNISFCREVREDLKRVRKDGKFNNLRRVMLQKAIIIMTYLDYSKSYSSSLNFELRRCNGINLLEKRRSKQ